MPRLHNESRGNTAPSPQLPKSPRVSRLDKTLYACDELTGLIIAVAHVRPEGLTGMRAQSVRKKMKQKSFAAAVNREDLVRGAEDLGEPFNEHIQRVVDAMATIADQLGFAPSGQSEGPASDK